MNALTRLPKLLAAIVLLWPAVAGAADLSVWPLTPYQVRVLLAVAHDAPLSPRLEASLSSALLARIEAVVGPPWNVSVAAPPAALRRDMLHGLDALQEKNIPIPSPEPDKILLVAVSVVPGGLKVTARDFDVHAREIGYPVTRRVWQIGSLCDASMDALLTAFAPIARIDRIEPDPKNKKDAMAVLRVKAAGLPMRDRNLKLVHPGDVFRPLVRFNNRDNKFFKAAQAQWSLCVAEKIAPEEVRCRIYTGMSREMQTKGKGRIEFLALRVQSPGGATLVVLQSRVEPKKPLAGCDVYAYPPGKKDAAALVGKTDRLGRLLVPALPGTLMRVLLFKDGSELLGKLPVVPGLERQLLAPIPNDDQRLGAEGFITGLQEELFDLIAREDPRRDGPCPHREEALRRSDGNDRRVAAFANRAAIRPAVGRRAGAARHQRRRHAEEDRHADERYAAVDRQVARSANHRQPGPRSPRREGRRRKVIPARNNGCLRLRTVGGNSCRRLAAPVAEKAGD